MSDPTGPEDQGEIETQDLAAVLSSFDARLREFSNLITEERQSRREWIEELIAAETRAREEYQEKEVSARRRRFIAGVTAAVIVVATLLGYYRTEQVIACDRHNAISESTRVVVLGAIDEVGNYATISAEDIDSIQSKVDERARASLPLRDCHWGP